MTCHKEIWTLTLTNIVWSGQATFNLVLWIEKLAKKLSFVSINYNFSDVLKFLHQDIFKNVDYNMILDILRTVENKIASCLLVCQAMLRLNLIGQLAITCMQFSKGKFKNKNQ